jgi:hypothetical protein
MTTQTLVKKVKILGTFEPQYLTRKERKLAETKEETLKKQYKNFSEKGIQTFVEPFTARKIFFVETYVRPQYLTRKERKLAEAKFTRKEHKLADKYLKQTENKLAKIEGEK